MSIAGIVFRAWCTFLCLAFVGVAFYMVVDVWQHDPKLLAVVVSLIALAFSTMIALFIGLIWDHS